MSATPTCSTEGCSRPVKVKKRGLCGACYMQAYRRGLLRPIPKPICKAVDCAELAYAKGWCSTHYHRARRAEREEA